MRGGHAGDGDVSSVGAAAEGTVGILTARQPGQSGLDGAIGLGGHHLESPFRDIPPATLSEPTDRLVVFLVLGNLLRPQGRHETNYQRQGAGNEPDAEESPFPMAEHDLTPLERACPC